MTTPTVTVVIPTIGRPDLRRALDSVRAQTVLGISIVVVLDRPDEQKAVESMLDGRDRLVVTDGAQGGAVARNLGIDSAATDYVAFLDDDDWWEPEKLQQQFELLDVTGGSVCFTAVKFHDGEQTTILPKEAFDPDRESLASYLVRRPGLRHGHGYLQSSTILVDRDHAERVRWDPSMAKHQDWDFVVRLLDGVDVQFCGAPLVHVQKDSAASVSRTRNWRASKQWLDQHGSKLDPHAYGDFVCSQVLRSALATMDRRGITEAARLTRHTRPSAASMVVGLSGTADYLRNRGRNV
ncbi:hypothetical protein GCM10007304_48910 [Rhodococcoides trifolii]|uniref:Glycosyltransferase 2-like domain-containing protein n=1 Tax=Rhodococcoides trifolii TaxID=908250 RepID=A0A917G8W9_9NOCA|nr:glycosyltransferase family 2 protein [Rhodococcus trifolii]GGG29288.1 hypothetical protein GCM10007304_48910 [Rhodococcus trifolii]